MKPDDFKAARERLGMNQPELARALGVSLAAVWRWEHGQRSISKVVELAMRYLQQQHRRKPAPDAQP